MTRVWQQDLPPLLPATGEQSAVCLIPLRARPLYGVCSMNAYTRWILLAMGFFVFAACGDTGSTAAPPIEDWCDLDRPRESCELRGARIVSWEDMSELCETECDSLGSVIIGEVDYEVLKGLKGFTKMSSLTLSSLDSGVVDLRFLSDLKELQSLSVYSNGGLRSLAGMEDVSFVKSCEQCDRQIQIEYNPKLRSFEGLQNVREVESLSIEGHENLEAIDGFDSLERASVFISGNAKLKRISGFKNMKNPSAIGITINQNLERIDGFTSVEQLDFLTLDRNRKLNMCDVDRILSQLEEPPEVVEISDSNGPLCVP